MFYGGRGRRPDVNEDVRGAWHDRWTINGGSGLLLRSSFHTGHTSTFLQTFSSSPPLLFPSLFVQLQHPLATGMHIRLDNINKFYSITWFLCHRKDISSALCPSLPPIDTFFVGPFRLNCWQGSEMWWNFPQIHSDKLMHFKHKTSRMSRLFSLMLFTVLWHYSYTICKDNNFGKTTKG